MGKLFDAMNKFDDNLSKRAKSRSSKTVRNKKPPVQVNRQKKPVPHPETSTHAEPPPMDQKPEPVASVPETPDVNVPEYESRQVPVQEKQYIIVNQPSQQDTAHRQPVIQEDRVEREQVRASLEKLRAEYSKLDIRKIDEPKQSFFSFNWRRKKDSFLHEKHNSLITESFNIIRSNILIKIKERNVRTVLVTSVAQADGKSLIAANLALSIAMGLDKYMLLIDTDYRKPTIHKYFGIDRDLGLTDYLIDSKISFDQIQHKDKKSKLSVIPAGSLYDNSAGIISSKIMKLFVQEVKYRYDDRIIMFDSPPIGMSDALWMSNLVDGVLLVVRSNKTDKKMLKNIIEKIGKDKILGVVVNYSKMSKKEYNYHKYYRS